MKLLFAIAISNHDAERAERLLDFVHHNCGKSGHLVLGLLSDLHDEMKARIRISASLAFEVVHEVELKPNPDRSAPKVAHTNGVLRQMATHIQAVFSWPFLWLEPDCTPMVHDWRERLWQVFDSQPMEFLGNRMKIKPKKEGDPELFFMARVGIYPREAFNKLMMGADSPVPLEISCGKLAVPRMGTTSLIQNTSIKTADDLLKVRDDAILVHGDKADLLLNQARETMPKPIKVGTIVHINLKEQPRTEKPDNRVTSTMLREILNGAK